MKPQIALPEWITKPDTSTAKLPTWLAENRALQWDAFAKYGIPTRKNERWKYADLSFLTRHKFTAPTVVAEDGLVDAINQHRLQRGDNILLVIVNGSFMPTLSDMEKLPADISVSSIGAAINTFPDLLKAIWQHEIDATKFPFANLNASVFTEGLFLHVPSQIDVALPIHILSLVVGADKIITHPHHVVILGENSRLTLVEEYFSLSEQAYMTNVMTTIYAGKNAQLLHYKIQNEGKQAVHIANTFIQQQQDSRVTCMNFSAGSVFARDDLSVRLMGSGAECKANGFYHLRSPNQYVDHHVDINHAAPRSNSEMLYKGILDNKSCAVFNGRLQVEKDAQKILAYQANHNLLLSDSAEVYSKPELEIYADDVKCKHGATTGQIDQAALFYMRSRGIAYNDAMTILLEGFADEIVQRITHAGVKMRVLEVMVA